MDREVQERFERIEADLGITARTLSAVAQSQLRLQETLGGLTASIGSYVDASNARMQRMEENLDALIRAIAAEHTNGRSQ